MPVEEQVTAPAILRVGVEPATGKYRRRDFYQVGHVIAQHLFWFPTTTSKKTVRLNLTSSASLLLANSVVISSQNYRRSKLHGVAFGRSHRHFFSYLPFLDSREYHKTLPGATYLFQQTFKFMDKIIGVQKIYAICKRR